MSYDLDGQEVATQIMTARVFIIAEAGVNHYGVLDEALLLCEEAKQVGADAMKFQTWVQPDLHPELRLSFDQFRTIARECEQIGIEFMSTPDDLESLRFLVEECGVKRIKIGSGSLTYRPFVEAAFATKLPVLLSTGMATMEEIGTVLSWPPDGTLWPSLTLMHCVSLYPCPSHLANLRAIDSLSQVLRLNVGWSDHTTSVTAIPCAAVALGATVIEKHLTLDSSADGPDHAMSLQPYQFKAMIDAIREVELALGDGVKRPSEEEARMIPLLRKTADGRQPVREHA